MSHAKINNILVKDRNNIVLQDIKGSDISINLNNQVDNSLENDRSQNKYTEAINPILKIIREVHDKKIDFSSMSYNPESFHRPIGRKERLVDDFFISSKHAIKEVCSEFYDNYLYRGWISGKKVDRVFVEQSGVFHYGGKDYRYTEAPDHKSAYIHLPSSNKFLNDTLIIPYHSWIGINLKNLLYKIIPYFNFTVFVVPVFIYSYYLNYSSGNKSNPYKGVREIVDLNFKFSEFLNFSQLIFLPKIISINEETGFVINESSYKIDLHQDAADNYFPLNNGGLQTDIEDTIMYDKIVVPYFKGISFHDLIKIKQNETESFKIFQHFLRRKLNELKSASTPDHIRYLSEEIEYEVQKLTLECKKLSKSLRVMNSAHLSFFCTSLVAAATQDFSAMAQTAAITGGAYSLYQSIKEYVSYKNKMTDLKKSDFYIPYLFKKEGVEKS